MTLLFRRRYVQFSLKTIALVVLVAGMAFSWWRHWLRSSELKGVRDQLRVAREGLLDMQRQRDAFNVRADYQRAILDVGCLLNLNDARHREALTTLCIMQHRWIVSSVEKETVKARSGRSMTVTLFHWDLMTHPSVIR